MIWRVAEVQLYTMMRYTLLTVLGRESTLQQCSAEAASMRVAWHYNTQLSAGDFVCVYVDGLLYDTRSVTRVDPQSSHVFRSRRSVCTDET